MRSTVSAVAILDYANKQLERKNDFATSSFKSGVCLMIERILFEAGAYSGFKFLGDSEVTSPDY